LLIGLLVPATGSASTPFCDVPSTNPYLAPLSGLPALRKPPRSGPLPFAPSVYIKPVSGPLVVNGEDIGFTFPVRHLGEEKTSQKPWLKVQVIIFALTRNGQVRGIAQQSTKFVRQDGATKITFSTTMRSGLYRADALFEERDGIRLGRYSEYFRAAPSRFGVHIALSSLQVIPGESVSARLENTGVVTVSSGYGYGIERFSGVSWEVDPSLQSERLAPRVLVILRPPAIFDCLQIPIPTSQAPGLYRFTKEVGSGGAGRMRTVITGEFMVLATGA
jgi:hypothetical protein